MNKSHISRHKLYGRDQLLAKTSKALPQKRCALIYGMKGNGKSAFIEALLKQPPLQGLMLTRNTINATTSAQNIYQMLASQLGDKSETVTIPTGGINSIKQRLSELKPQASSDEMVIWLENAHLLFTGDEFDDEDIQHLIVAIHAVPPNCYWLFELRE